MFLRVKQKKFIREAVKSPFIFIYLTMIKFNELRITNDGKYLIIDASVRNTSYYDNVYIDSIYIDTQDTYKDGGPSSSVVYSNNITNASPDFNYKRYRWELSVGDLLPSLSNNLFFIYVKAKGTPKSDTPCGMDNEYTLGVTFDTCSLYNALMSYVREVNNSCDIPKNFIDLFLQFKALEISINTDHYMQAIDFYNSFIKDIKLTKSIKSCNCHG